MQMDFYFQVEQRNQHRLKPQLLTGEQLEQPLLAVLIIKKFKKKTFNHLNKNYMSNFNYFCYILNN